MMSKAEMASKTIDDQFNRALEIVNNARGEQHIQLDYTQKLALYSYYKQATVGKVDHLRPSFFELIRCAKWDAWEKLGDMDSSEAKRRYTDIVHKILGKKDTTVAHGLVQELRPHEASQEPASSQTLVRTLSTLSNSSGSTVSNESPLLPPRVLPQEEGLRDDVQHNGDDASESSDGGDVTEEAQELARPFSSMSQYRTPNTTFATSPPLYRANVSAMQPSPLYEVESAFQGPLPTSATSSALSPPFASTTRLGRVTSPSRDLMPHFQGRFSPLPFHSTSAHPRPASRTEMPVEMVVENIQAHLTALRERIDSLEASVTLQSQRSIVSMHSMASSGRGSSSRNQTEPLEWNIDDMGLWTYVLQPLALGIKPLKRVLIFLCCGDRRSLVLMIIRRLCLDVSFMLVVLALLRAIWKKSRARRRAINVALGILWAALTGNHRQLTSHTI